MKEPDWGRGEGRRIPINKKLVDTSRKNEKGTKQRKK